MKFRQIKIICQNLNSKNSIVPASAELGPAQLQLVPTYCTYQLNSIIVQTYCTYRMYVLIVCTDFTYTYLLTVLNDCS